MPVKIGPTNDKSADFCQMEAPVPNSAAVINPDGRGANFVKVTKEMFAPGHYWDLTQYVFGMGIDGNADNTSSSSMPGCTFSSNVYTATRDLAYDNLTLYSAPTSTVLMNGWKLFVRGRLTIAGSNVIMNDGALGTSGGAPTAGVAGTGRSSRGSLGGSAAGGNGGAGGVGANGANGNQGSSLPEGGKGGGGGFSGRGGNQSTGTGGTSGGGGTVVASSHTGDNLFHAIHQVQGPSLVLGGAGGAGGAGGGAGSGSTGGGGGGGGAGGGGLLVVCNVLDLSQLSGGRISVNGGNGGNGGNGTGSGPGAGGGGGGGGGGGHVTVIYRSILGAANLAYISAAGGAAGTAGTGGTDASNGAAGAAGRITLIDMLNGYVTVPAFSSSAAGFEASDIGDEEFEDDSVATWQMVFRRTN